jgi:hypothetical protein
MFGESPVAIPLSFENTKLRVPFMGFVLLRGRRSGVRLTVP